MMENGDGERYTINILEMKKKKTVVIYPKKPPPS